VAIEAPFFLSVAALSGALAGLAGLVAAIRRGEGLDVNDRFRLREIVEFAFANILFALAVFPLASLIGSLALALQVASGAVLVYLFANVLILGSRRRRLGLPVLGTWAIAVGALNITALVFGGITLVTGSVAGYAALLLVLLARPMLAFVLVLTSFESGQDAGASQRDQPNDDS
jgi:hypothetical protein